MINHRRAAMVASFAAFAALSLAAPAALASSPPVGAAQSAATIQPVKVVPDVNKLICKTEPGTGSRLGGKRKCMTRTQWTKKNWADHNTLDDMAASQMGH